MKGKKTNAKERLIKLGENASERRRVFAELCRHLSAGYSIECFPPLSKTSIRDFITRYPQEFCEAELEEAIRAGQDNWERLGRKQADGSCLGNSKTWYYNMANRYGWRERVEIEAEHKGQLNVSIVDYSRKQKPSD